MSFNRCAAIKVSGERCNRLVSLNSEFCHSHRNYIKPKENYNHLDPFKDLHLEFSEKYIPVILCEMCQEPVTYDSIVSLDDGNGGYSVYCIACAKFQARIEKRIGEICSTPAGLTPEKIQDDLETFGVDPDLTEKIRKRMIAEKRLQEVEHFDSK